MNNTIPTDILHIITKLTKEQARPYIDKLEYCCEKRLLRPEDKPSSGMLDCISKLGHYFAGSTDEYLMQAMHKERLEVSASDLKALVDYFEGVDELIKGGLNDQ